MQIRKSGLGLLTLAALMSASGCGSLTSGDAASPASTTPSAIPSSSRATASAGDVAACKAYLRVEPVANESIKGNWEDMPASFIEDRFHEWADDLESGTVAATEPTLIEPVKGTVAGLRSAAATTAAWKDGTLDLVPDLTVVYEQSQQVALMCDWMDPSGTYRAIVNAG